MTENAVEEKARSLRWAMGLSGFLILLKGVSGVISSSTALLASALDSLMDMGISSVNYLTVKKGSKPPDSEHAYGHGKIESLVSYTQGVVFVLFAVVIFIGSFRKGSEQSAAIRSGLAMWSIGIAAGVNLVITGILDRTQQKTGSLILKAERMHYVTDILSYLLIFVALALVSWTGWNGWDIVAALCVAVYIAFLASQILLQAGNELVDRSLPKQKLDELDALIRRHDLRISGYHELRTRKVGDKNFIDFHLVLKSNPTLEIAHEIADSLIRKIKAHFPNADVTIHEDTRMDE